MKPTFFPLFILALLVGLAACNRKISTDKAPTPSMLTGSWELRESQAGMTPTKQLPEGNGNRYRFTANKYEQYVNGNLQRSGSYRLEKDTTVEKEVGLELPDGQFTTQIIFDEDASATKTFLDLEAGKLTFLSGFFPVDAGSRLTYRKVAEGN